MTQEEIALIGWSFRIFERSLIALLIVLGCVIYAIAFSGAFQKIKIRLGDGEKNADLNLVLAMPVFMLIVLIGFAWVSFSHPVSVTLTASGNNNAANDIILSGVGAGEVSGQLDAIIIQDLQQAKNELDRIISKSRPQAVELKTVRAIIVTAQRDLVVRNYGNDLIAECLGQSDKQGCQEIEKWLD